MCQPAMNVIATIVVVASSPWVRADQPSAVQFDLPPTVAAVSTGDPTLVTFELNLSSMIETSAIPPISHWMVRCIPRDHDISIADYSPRTETGSDVSTPIQVKQTAEESQSSGLNIDGTYSNLVRAHAGSDRGKKHSNSLQFDRSAPMQAVTAAGTIRRGQGVYFKLRWTSTQVLEGEKTFSITMRVPPHWRGGLIDVTVKALSESPSSSPFALPSWDRGSNTVGRAHFIVAAYRSGDVEAQTLARSVSECEQRLRHLCERFDRADSPFSFPSMVRRISTKLDWTVSADHRDSIEHLLRSGAKVNWDQQLDTLPMPIRIAALDYVDHRDRFMALRSTSIEPTVAAKPPL